MSYQQKNQLVKMIDSYRFSEYKPSTEEIEYSLDMELTPEQIEKIEEEIKKVNDAYYNSAPWHSTSEDGKHLSEINNMKEIYIKKYQKENILNKYKELQLFRKKEMNMISKEKYDKAMWRLLKYHIDILSGTLIVNPIIKNNINSVEFKELYERTCKICEEFKMVSDPNELDQLY